MNEQDVINLIKNRLKLELDCVYGIGFDQNITIKLMLNTGTDENPKYECISKEKLSTSHVC